MGFMAFLVLGRLAIWMIQISGLLRPVFQIHPILQEFASCDLCLGVWVFSGLAWALGINIIEPIYVPVLSEALSGIAASFAVHLAVLGWQVKFGATDLG